MCRSKIARLAADWPHDHNHKSFRHEHSKKMQLYDNEWVSKDTALLYKIMDELDDRADAQHAGKAGRFDVVGCAMIVVVVLGLPPTARHWKLREMLLRCEPVVGSMGEAEATWLVQLTADPKQLLQCFLDMGKERHLPISLRFEPDGNNVQAACLRTIWRYLAFHKFVCSITVKG